MVYKKAVHDHEQNIAANLGRNMGQLLIAILVICMLVQCNNKPMQNQAYDNKNPDQQFFLALNAANCTVNGQKYVSDKEGEYNVEPHTYCPPLIAKWVRSGFTDSDAEKFLKHKNDSVVSEGYGDTWLIQFEICDSRGLFGSQECETFHLGRD